VAIPSEWGWIGPRLAKAIETDPERTPEDVLCELVSGELHLWLASGPDVSGLVVTTAGYVIGTGRKGFWVLYAQGEVSGGPRQRLAAYSGMMGLFETMARDCGAEEVWVEARSQWGRALKDYELVRAGPERTSYRKVL
jgi:hypothetical protein